MGLATGTLLNRLFGTTFDVMNESERRQTTKGTIIFHLSGYLSSHSHSLGVVRHLDVQSERPAVNGHGRRRHRRPRTRRRPRLRTQIRSIFPGIVGGVDCEPLGASSGAVPGSKYGPAEDGVRSELGTLWEEGCVSPLPPIRRTDDVLTRRGDRSTAGSRTLLLFVIRDHVGSTPLSNLQATLIADLRKIWDGLSKPEGLQQATLDDYFDMSFVALSHKVRTAT